MSSVGQLKNFLWSNLYSIGSFLLVGAVTAVFYFSLFGCLWQLLHLNYNIAVSLAYLAAITLYFFANRKFTFKKQADSLAPQLIKYFLMILFNYLVTLTIINVIVQVFHLTPYFGLVVAVCVTFALSYLIAKFWVFQTS